MKRRRVGGRTVLILAGLTVIAYLLALGTFDAYVAGVADLLLLATITTGVIAIVTGSGRNGHWVFPAALLGVLLALILVTGMLKAAWLAANLPSPHDRSSGLPYVLLASLAPIAIAVAAIIQRNAPLETPRKVVRVEVVGIAVGFLPWVLLMITGIAA